MGNSDGDDMSKDQESDTGKPVDAAFTTPDDKNGNVEFAKRGMKTPRRRTRKSRQQPKAK